MTEHLGTVVGGPQTFRFEVLSLQSDLTVGGTSHQAQPWPFGPSARSSIAGRARHMGWILAE